jgi:hypothetical protein
MTYIVKPMQIIEPRDRAEYIHTLVEVGDYVSVEFYDGERTHRKVEGIFRSHPFTSETRYFQHPDTTHVVIDVHNAYKMQRHAGEERWVGGASSAVAVIDTAKIALIENIDGPVSTGRIDEQALRQAIAEALGNVSTESLVQDVVDTYTSLTD